MTEWHFTILKSAQRYLQRLSKTDQERIVRALKYFVSNPKQADIKPLQGRSELRLRVGDYRVLFLVDKTNRLYIVTRIGTCGDVYK